MHTVHSAVYADGWTQERWLDKCTLIYSSRRNFVTRVRLASRERPVNRCKNDDNFEYIISRCISSNCYVSVRLFRNAY